VIIIIDITFLSFNLMLNVHHFGDEDRDTDVALGETKFSELSLEVIGANLRHRPDLFAEPKNYIEIDVKVIYHL
jgi:hypothetical protein